MASTLSETTTGVAFTGAVQSRDSNFPPPPERQFLPCIEQPTRCFLSCRPAADAANDATADEKRRLSSARDGRVFFSDKRSNQESFVLVPQDDGTILIQSFRDQRFLRKGGVGIAQAAANTHQDNAGNDVLSASSNDDEKGKPSEAAASAINDKKEDGGGGESLWRRTSKSLGRESSSTRVHTEDKAEAASLWSRASQTLSNSRLRAQPDSQEKDSATNSDTDNTDKKSEANLWTRASKMLAERRASLKSTVVSTTDKKEDASRWCLEKVPNNGGFYLKCANEDDDDKNETTYLACSRDGTITLVSNKDDEQQLHSACCCWTLEFQTGELCYISSPAMDRRVRCDLVGSLSLSENYKGWEVWRFIEAADADGDGLVRISAWMHHNHFLSSTSNGTVSATTNPQSDDGTLWAVAQDAGGNGVTIRSAVHERVLYCDNESLFTDPHGGAFGVWQLEAAHRQKYSLCSAVDSKSIGPFPYVTDNKRQTDEWEVEKYGDTMAFFAPEQRQYLGSTSDGDVRLIPLDEVSERESWFVETRPDGGYGFRSTKHGRYLCWIASGEKDGSLCTVSEGEVERATWRLDPCMPRAVSGGKIKTFAIGTTAAVATTVAMPFVTAGIIGLIGAEVGVLADIVIVGLTGAEAIASVGVVGTTAALVFKESGDSFGSKEGESIEEGSDTRPFTKRPFAAIGSGKQLKEPEVL